MKDELFVYWTFRRSRHNIFEGLGGIEHEIHVCILKLKSFSKVIAIVTWAMYIREINTRRSNIKCIVSYRYI